MNAAHSPQPLPPGTPVEVYNRFSSSWTRGFVVTARRATAYRLRRVSDHAVLPSDFARQDLRQQRR